jgi:dTDP-4-dehydrorhamnose reductase
MILLLGSSGYVGCAFARFFQQHSIPFTGASRRQVDYTDRDTLIKLIDQVAPEFLINAAGYTGKPNVDACEFHKPECLAGNAVLPGTVRAACEHRDLPWGHVSSGCIYTGTRADGHGFSEEDPPNFCFRANNCSFYSGSKALGEECLDGAENVFLWRLRIPFNNQDSPRNYLSKLMRYEMLLEATNSISQLDESIRAAWACWDRRIDPGIYHLTNPGAVTTREVTEMIQEELTPAPKFQFFRDEQHFMQIAAKAPRSNCILDSSKILQAGIKMSHAHDAIRQALRRWEKEEV